MKKIFAFLMTLFLMLGVAACVEVGGQLDAPVISISNNTVSWKAVDGAEGYLVNIDDIVKETKNTSYNLLTLNLEPGSYLVSVVAYAKDKKVVSKTSNKIAYNFGVIFSDDLENDLYKIFNEKYHAGMTQADFFSAFPSNPYGEYQNYLNVKQGIDVYLDLTKNQELTDENKFYLLFYFVNFVNGQKPNFEEVLSFLDRLTQNGLTSKIGSELLYDVMLYTLDFFLAGFEPEDNYYSDSPFLEFKEELINDKDNIIASLESILNFIIEVRKTLTPEFVDQIQTLITTGEIANETIITIKDAVVDEMLYHLPSELAFETTIKILFRMQQLNSSVNVSYVTLEIISLNAKLYREQIKALLNIIKDFTINDLEELKLLIDSIEKDQTNGYKMVSFIFKHIVRYLDKEEIDLNELITFEEFENLVLGIVEQLSEFINIEIADLVAEKIEVLYDVYTVLISKTRYLLEHDLIAILLMSNAFDYDQKAFYKEILTNEFIAFYREFNEDEKAILIDAYAQFLVYSIGLDTEGVVYTYSKNMLLAIDKVVVDLIDLINENIFTNASNLLGDTQEVYLDAYVLAHLLDEFLKDSDNQENLIDVYVYQELLKQETEEFYHAASREFITNNLENIKTQISDIVTYDFTNLSDQEKLQIEKLMYTWVSRKYYYPSRDNYNVIELEFIEEGQLNGQIYLDFQYTEIVYNAEYRQKIKLITDIDQKGGAYYSIKSMDGYDYEYDSYTGQYYPVIYVNAGESINIYIFNDYSMYINYSLVVESETKVYDAAVDGMKEFRITNYNYKNTEIELVFVQPGLAYLMFSTPVDIYSDQNYSYYFNVSFLIINNEEANTSYTIINYNDVINFRVTKHQYYAYEHFALNKDEVSVLDYSSINDFKVVKLVTNESMMVNVFYPDGYNWNWNIFVTVYDEYGNLYNYSSLHHGTILHLEQNHTYYILIFEQENIVINFEPLE